MITKRRVLRIVNDVARAQALDWTKKEWKVFADVRSAIRLFLPESEQEAPLEGTDKLIQVLNEEEAGW